MNKINKFVAFLILVFVISLFGNKQAFAAEDLTTQTPQFDVAPFSDEIKVVSKPLVVEEKKIEPIQGTKIVSTNESSIKIIYPSNEGILDGSQIIRGSVKSGYNVKVYVDDKYRTTLLLGSNKSGVMNFYYEPVQKLDLGKHTVKFVSSKNSKDYDSDSISFEVKAGYSSPMVLTPYYYKDAPSTYVIRGYANTGDKVEVYVDDRKVRVVNSLLGTKSTTYFALAVTNLKEGQHKAYVLAYDKVTGLPNQKSKTVYFEVSLNGSKIETKEPEKPIIKKDSVKIDVKKDEVKKPEIKKDEVKKESTKKQEIKKVDSKKVDVKKEVKKSEPKQDKSILIGIVLLIIAVALIIFWLISENKEKVKKFIDNLFEEDDEDKKDDSANK